MRQQGDGVGIGQHSVRQPACVNRAKAQPGLYIGMGLVQDHGVGMRGARGV